MILTYRLIGNGARELTGHWFTEEEARAYLNRRAHDPLDNYMYVLEGLPARERLAVRVLRYLAGVPAWHLGIPGRRRGTP